MQSKKVEGGRKQILLKENK